MKTIVPTLVLLLLCACDPLFSAKTTSKATSKTEKAPLIKTESDAFKYLNKFGYNPCGGDPSDGNGKDKPPILCQSSMNTMLELFQKHYKLPVTGKLDKKTAQLMSSPRCGRKDEVFKKSAFKTYNSWSFLQIFREF